MEGASGEDGETEGVASEGVEWRNGDLERGSHAFPRGEAVDPSPGGNGGETTESESQKRRRKAKDKGGREVKKGWSANELALRQWLSVMEDAGGKKQGGN